MKEGRKEGRKEERKEGKKEGRTKNWKKDSIFNKWCWSDWMVACKRIQIDPYVNPVLNSKWIKNLNIKPDTLTLREEKGE